ncbi:hypothetical protein CN311_25050 [Mesorhizobium sanjuanii]|uniref:Propionyl-coenzyme A carboxylase alpha polypeptide n=1 Tax=Mesorhizobium sanjuanii TaxID=2037900 RepID=A0A2A6F9E4_9HYPH|nr:hypothetical protein CN311_25050 [Mesorhizobium sanjuanii]
MPGRAEGGAVECRPPTPIAPDILEEQSLGQTSERSRSFAPPSVLPDISPTRGEIGSFAAGSL